MNLKSAFLNDHITLTEEEAEQLREAEGGSYTVGVRPPRNGEIPSTLPDFVKNITEFQTKVFRLGNASPTTVFEIRRDSDLKFQLTVPTKRLERKLRTHLSNTIPGIGFEDGVSGLPVAEETTVGGGLLTTGRPSYFPLRTDFDSPPANSLASALHRHAMQNTRVVVQILFTPMVGQPLRNWWWKTWAYKRRNYLRKEKEKLWGNRTPTKREKTQARQIDRKAGTGRFKTAIRFLFIGSGEYTASRVKELAGAFNVYENADTDQYLNAVTVRSLRRSQILRFAQAVADRQYQGWSRSFRTTPDELAALVSIPDRNQQNIRNAQP